MAKIIVIEGIDGSGKQTQSELLEQTLSQKYSVLKLSFPNYNSSSSIFIKQYLNGDFGLYDNIYATSTFFAIDRYLTLREIDLNKYDFIICDRYTQSNMLHQGVKTPNKQEYINWLKEYEYEKLQIPKPDFVFYLNLSFETAKERMQNRDKKHENADIHEENFSYMESVAKNANIVAHLENWITINCDNKDKSIIHNNILSYLRNEGI